VDVLAGEVGDHLVGVHVRGGARAGLEDVDRELAVVLAGRDLVGGRGNDRPVRAQPPLWAARVGAVVEAAASPRVTGRRGEQIVVTYDSGIRGASDIIKAIAIGAKFVFVGRLWIWGLSIMGEEGVRHVMNGLLADFDITMAVGGLSKVEDIDRDYIESLPKQYSLITERSKL